MKTYFNLSFLEGFHENLRSVLDAIIPLILFFLVFQVLWMRLPRESVIRILKGTALAAIGLFLFLQGVRIGFLPFGHAIGEALSKLPYRWLLAPFGFVLGFATTWSEPSVRILADQVEEASSGSIRQIVVLTSICLAVGLVVSLGMLRIGYDIPLLHILIPGYAIAIAIMWLGEKDFVAIAVDAGGVATGPMANTFLLALALGVSSGMGDRDPLLHGLGLMALIALAPILTVMLVGIFYGIDRRRKEVGK